MVLSSFAVLAQLGSDEDDVNRHFRQKKISYSKEILLSLAGSNSCQLLPSGLKQVLDASLFCDSSGCSKSSYRPLVHTVVAAQPDAGSNNGSQSKPWLRSTSSEGLLGCGVNQSSPACQYVTSAPRESGSGLYLLKRSTEPYCPPHRHKNASYSGGKFNSNGDSLLGSAGCLSIQTQMDGRSKSDDSQLKRSEISTDTRPPQMAARHVQLQGCSKPPLNQIEKPLCINNGTIWFPKFSVSGVKGKNSDAEDVTVVSGKAMHMPGRTDLTVEELFYSATSALEAGYLNRSSSSKFAPWFGKKEHYDESTVRDSTEKRISVEDGEKQKPVCRESASSEVSKMCQRLSAEDRGLLGSYSTLEPHSSEEQVPNYPGGLKNVDNHTGGNGEEAPTEFREMPNFSYSWGVRPGSVNGRDAKLSSSGGATKKCDSTDEIFWPEEDTLIINDDFEICQSFIMSKEKPVHVNRPKSVAAIDVKEKLVATSCVFDKFMAPELNSQPLEQRFYNTVAMKTPHSNHQEVQSYPQTQLSSKTSESLVAPMSQYIKPQKLMTYSYSPSGYAETRSNLCRHSFPIRGSFPQPMQMAGGNPQIMTGQQGIDSTLVHHSLDQGAAYMGFLNLLPSHQQTYWPGIPQNFSPRVESRHGNLATAHYTTMGLQVTHPSRHAMRSRTWTDRASKCASHDMWRI